MKNNNEESWVSFPRKVRMDRIGGLISPSEYELYVWMRHGADPYGMIVVSLEGLVADFSHRAWSKNHINKLMLTLRAKRYLHYETRTGRRGSFQVRFPDFFMPNGAVSRLETLENAGLVRGVTTASAVTPPEETPENRVPNQSFEAQRESINKLVQTFSMNRSRGSNNDKETKKENEINRSFEEDRRDIPVVGYMPNSYEEQLCFEIAQELGEQTMNFLLGTYHKYELGVIESAWNEYKELSEHKKFEIEDKAKYFNGIVHQLLMKQGKNNRQPSIDKYI